jgi:hypothetical protein
LSEEAMRVLLIFLQTVAFLMLVAAVLLSLWLCTNRIDFSESASFLKNAVVSIFANWIIDLMIFAFLAIFNIWFVLGPLMQIEDPVRRTVQHLSIIFIQTAFLLAVAALSFTIMMLCGTTPR